MLAATAEERLIALPVTADRSTPQSRVRLEIPSACELVISEETIVPIFLYS
jgi:hypothetical protein